MIAGLVTWFAVIVVTATCTGLLLTRDWRWELGLMAAQYVGVAILAAQHWPLGMAAVKLVTGWMATAALGMTLTLLPPQEGAEQPLWPQGSAFRLFLAGMIIVLAVAVTSRIQSAMAGVGAPVIAGTIVLTGIGLLQLGTSSEIPRTIFGLLTVLAGFEILYAALEGSILVAGLLAVVNLGLGLVGAYLLNATAVEDTQ
jgi:hypothetical protein